MSDWYSGLFKPQYFEKFSAEELLSIDLRILNRIYEAEKEALEKYQRKAEDRRLHPGMERYDSEEEFWAEVKDAQRESLRGYE